MFIDLAKAYDSVDRAALFEAFTVELGVPDALVKAFVLLYTGI